jgi:hypothetical protein
VQNKCVFAQEQVFWTLEVGIPWRAEGEGLARGEPLSEMLGGANRDRLPSRYVPRTIIHVSQMNNGIHTQSSAPFL